MSGRPNLTQRFLGGLLVLSGGILIASAGGCALYWIELLNRSYGDALAFMVMVVIIAFIFAGIPMLLGWHLIQSGREMAQPGKAKKDK